MNRADLERSEIRGWVREHLFDEVPMAVAVVDQGYRILAANRRFEEAFGRWRDRPCYEVYKGRSDPCLRCVVAETLADGRLRTREEAGVTNDGTEIDYLVHVVPVMRPDGAIPYVIEMSTDISPVKRLEREKREAERLAAVGETVAGVAHGIKNVLMGLEGGMYAVNTGIATADDARIAQGWATLEESVERISEFVKEFLDFAKGRETTVSPVDPLDPARKVATLYRERAGQDGIQLVTDFPEAMETAALDADGIHTCLANLVSNAIDACTVADADRGFVVTLSVREEEGALVYEVSDNGRGMDYEISRKIFTRFFTGKGSDRGTGLGLLTTKRIVHQHGGRVSFSSKEGEGSVFRIRLPRSDLPEPAPQEPPPPETPAQET